MSNTPTESELEDLEALEKAGTNHFKLLICVVFSGLITFMVPDPFMIISSGVTAVLALLFGVSLINMQYFQRCPRCKNTLSSTASACHNCQLDFNFGKKKGDGSEWYK